jgi:putative type I restriction-modification system specificity protein
MMSILEEIQNCPVEWKELGEVALLKRGKTITSKTATEGPYPVISGGQKPAYFHGEFNREGETITVAGSGAYAGYVMYWDEPIFVSDAFSIEPLEGDLIPKFLYYYLLEKQETLFSLKKGSGVPHVYPKDVSKILIPIPPLEIQEKIVQILDKMTEYVTELTSELTSRKKQYTFYQDKLLSFEAEVYQVEWKTIQDISVKIVTGVTPKKSCEDYYLKGTIPWLRTNEVKFNTITTTEKYVTEKAVEETGLKWIVPNSIIIAISGATAGRVAMNSIPLTTNQHCCSISVDERIVNYKYLYYWLVNQNRQILSLKQGARGDINMSMIKSFKIPVPSLEIQSRIVQVLDNFDMVCNDLNIGLPKEIELRQKQYEYFREKLLTFLAEGEYTDSTVQYSTDKTSLGSETGYLDQFEWSWE